jgi:hypothetical protein
VRIFSSQGEIREKLHCCFDWKKCEDWRSEGGFSSCVFRRIVGKN